MPKLLIWTRSEGGAYVSNGYMIAERIDNKGWNATGPAPEYVDVLMGATLDACKAACQAHFNTPPTLAHWPYCEKCHQPFEFDKNEPFAYCGCGTTEWGNPRPAEWVPDPAFKPQPMATPTLPEGTQRDQLVKDMVDSMYEEGMAFGFTADLCRRYLVSLATKPIDVMLHCPKCKEQHIDMPEPGHLISSGPNAGRVQAGWTNPPHKSHKCAHCGCVWRASDTPTNGKRHAESRGKGDNWPTEPWE